MAQHAADDSGTRPELIDRALRLYVAKTRRENEEGRSWIRQPNNLISVVAIVLSLLNAFYLVIKDHYDAIDKDLQSLSGTVADLAKLDSDILTATFTDPQRLTNLGLVLNNRRIALLAEADRLIGNLGDRVPRAQLAVIGPAYAQVNDYDKAIKYFTMMTELPASSTMRAEAWRSIATVYAYEGPDFNQKVRDAFASAAQIFPDPKDLGSIGVVASVYEQWAQFEASQAEYAKALERFEQARRFADRLPCPTMRQAVAARIAGEVSQAFASYRPDDPTQMAAMRGKMAALASANVCGG